MGSGSSSELGPLAVAAVAQITRFDLDHLRVLRQHFQLAASLQHDHDDREHDSIAHEPVDANHYHHVGLLPRHQEPNLTHASFMDAFESADCFFASDCAIFDRLFTLLDRTGDDEILAAEFLVGVCALLQGDLTTKLQAAMELLRDDTTKPEDTSSSSDGSVSRHELTFVITTMTLVASYFGDPPMVKRTALSIVDDVFTATSTSNKTLSKPPEDNENEAAETVESADSPTQAESSSLPVTEAVARLAQHPLIDQYIRGQLVGVSAQLHA